jgi:adenylosuccinate lyase
MSVKRLPGDAAALRRTLEIMRFEFEAMGSDIEGMEPFQSWVETRAAHFEYLDANAGLCGKVAKLDRDERHEMAQESGLLNRGEI